MRKSFKVPSPARPRMNTSVNSRTTRASIGGQSTVKRQPLLSITANQSHRKSTALKTPSKTVSKNVPHDLDESTFDGSELFSGTPGEAMLDLGHGVDEDLENRL